MSTPNLLEPAPYNPFAARLMIFTIVTPDFEVSMVFYLEMMGYEVIGSGELPLTRPDAPGAKALGRRYALVREKSSERGAIRLLEAPDGAAPNRPRPQARAWDPGLAVMECMTDDATRSHHLMTNAGVRTITPPRPYFFRNTMLGDLDVESYAAFGPAGEQLFVTANVRADKPRWPYAGLHGPVGAAILVTLDRRPLWDFYERALGLTVTSELECQQETTNELIGAPPDTYFKWGFVGGVVSIEWEEYRMPEGNTYPTSLDRTGLAMLTLRVNDVSAVRRRCAAAGIAPFGEGSFPVPRSDSLDGFYLRGPVGELIEIVGHTHDWR